jgi:hypothetical protein
MTKQFIDYTKTIIYKIVCNDLTIRDVYVGHTTNFINRKAKHKSDCNNPNSKSYNFKIYNSIRNNGGWLHWSMIEIEKFQDCNDINEASAKERYYYEVFNAKLNTNCPGRNNKEYKKEYYLGNKNKIQKNSKYYYENNKNKIILIIFVMFAMVGILVTIAQNILIPKNIKQNSIIIMINCF